MSVNFGGTFHETRVIAQALTCYLNDAVMTAEERTIGEDMLAYIRKGLWTYYPYLSEDYFDQDAGGPFSITLFPPDTIAANLAAREAGGR